MPKGPASPSPLPEESSLRPKRASLKSKQIDDFGDFLKDVKSTVRRMLPTTGQRYKQAAILAIGFSVSDPDVIPLRNELLGFLSTTYNWSVQVHTIDCNKSLKKALFELQDVMDEFHRKYRSDGENDSNLLTYYFFGHAYVQKQDQLFLCGSMDPSGNAVEPWIKWDYISGMTRSAIADDHQLCILDFCSTGLLSLGEDIEIIAATSWDEIASSDPRSSFTRSFIDTLKQFNGKSVTSTQIVSSMYNYTAMAKLGSSQPFFILSSYEDREPALFHKITTSPTPQPIINEVPRHAHVSIKVKVAKANTVSDAAEFSQWLSTNLPEYIGEIHISAKWKAESATVMVILPIEVWLDLPDRRAYAFVDYRPYWDARSTRSV